MSDTSISTRGSTGLIDVHHHIVPDQYVKALARKGITKALGVPLPKWNLNTTLDVMDQNEIATSVISISAPGVYFGNVDEPLPFARQLAHDTNDICAEIVADHSDRFCAFATLPLPDIDAALRELEYALDHLKFDGVALFSNYDGYYLGDSKFEALHAELNRRKVVVFIHPSSPPGLEQSHLGLPEALLDVCFDTTRAAYSLVVHGVMQRHPDISFILSHAGGTLPYLAGRVSMTAKLLANAHGIGPAIGDAAGLVSRIFPGLKDSMPELLKYYINFKKNVIPDGPEYFLRKFHYDTALSASPHTFASLLTVVDSSRILFGSDYVFATRDAVPLTIRGIQDFATFTPSNIAAIMRDNAVRLFPRLGREVAVASQ
ncbi:MAG: amidohydrolase [Proteobacteria bacterium]|nr:amidohydrolase [Pseudomonadota bacterium]